MMNTMFRKMKEVLPPRASFRLRTFKSELLDGELRALRTFAKLMGGPEVHAVDVGANSGIYSAALSRYFQRVVAIEPNPDCVDYMRHVLPPNCVLVPAAVSDREGRTTLRIPVVDGASETTRATISTGNAFTGLDVSNTREIDVAVQSIDGLARAGTIAIDRLGLLKVDVEGHELAVLNGARAVLTAARPGLCIEMERRHGTQTTDAFDLLHGIGYRAVRYEGGHYAIVDVDGPDRGTATDLVNLFFVTEDKLHRLGIKPQ